MKVIVPVVASIFLIIIFSEITLAAPFLHTPQPGNNTYTTGGTVDISINISDDNLNTSSTIVKIIELSAYQQGEQWETKSLSCNGGTTQWKCSFNFPTSIIGTDTVELFYFEANDTDGVTGSNGTSSNPLRFTIDRLPPIITLVSPTNNSYVGGNKTISITVTDTSSGVNNDTVQYSTDGSSWTTTKNVSASSFEAVWNTTIFSNNQTVTLYARATDNVRNNVSVKINVTVDNEMPGLVVLSALSGNLSGNIQLQVNVSDSYSGVNLGNIRYNVDSASGSLGCSGNNYTAACNTILDTTQLQDGNHILTLSATDNAGNLNATTVQIKTKNTQPTITISEPSNNAFIKGLTLIRASLSNTDGIASVQISIEQGSNITTNNMMCNSNLTSCNYSLNTTSFADGGYTIRASAMNSSGAVVTSSISVTIDNTLPILTITQPTGTVSGDIEIKADVIDANLNQKNVIFSIHTFTGNLTCTPQTPSRFICSTTFNSKQLGNAKYSLNVSAVDKAGNIAMSSHEITIAKQGGASSTGSGSGGGGVVPAEKSEVEQTGKKNIPPLQISLPFESKYIILGIVVASALVIIVLLVVIAKHRLDKSIITTG